MSSRLVLLLALLAGCGSAIVVPPGEDASTGNAGLSTSTGADGPDTTTGSAADSTTTTGPLDPTTGGTSTGSADAETDCSFLCDDSSDSGILVECSIWDQDCPPGMKCSPRSLETSWDSLSCVPVDPDPDDVGESCTVEGSGASGLNSCGVGAMCWDVDPETNIGTCVPHCIGSQNAPACADPSRVCLVAGILTLCLSHCDPLAPACPEGDGCYPSGDAFVCAPDASGKDGGLLEPCEYINGCEAGLLCGAPEDVGDLCGADAPGCCVPPCHLDAPSCPPMTACIPFFEDGEVPPGYTGVGICGTGSG